jgi:hypothetical protein
MAILRLAKAREATHLKAEEYKRHARLYLESIGFQERSNSAREGNLADLVFVPQAGLQDRRPRWVECKATTLGLNDKKFGEEVKKYLGAWLLLRPTVRFDFWVFAQKLNASKSWEEVFGDEVDAESLFKWLKAQPAKKKVQAVIDAANRTDIISFFVESTVVDADAAALDLVTQDRLKGEGLIHASRKRAMAQLELIEQHRDPVSAKSQLTANLIPIVMPKRFAIIETDFGSRDQIQAAFREQVRQPNGPPPSRPPWAYLESGRLLAIHNDMVEREFRPIAGRLVETFDLDEVQENHAAELIQLMNRVIEKVCFHRGVAHGEQGFFFLAEGETTRGEPRVIEAGARKLQVTSPKPVLTKPAEEASDAPMFGSLQAQKAPAATTKEIAYVYHEGFTAWFHRLWGESYVILGLKRAYTEDGRTRIEGDRAAALDETYRDPRFNRSDTQARKLEVMSKYLFGTDPLWNKPEWAKQVRFGDLLTIPIDWEPKKVDMHMPAFLREVKETKP